MKILITTDGSKFSRTAINACREIVCDAEKTSFKIISAVEFPQMIAADPFVGASAEFYQQIETQGQNLAKTFLADAEKNLRELFPQNTLDISTEIIDGAPARVIVEAAKKWSADLIVTGSHGYGFWDRAMLGSVSTSIVHQAPCSVLVVRMKENSGEK